MTLKPSPDQMMGADDTPSAFDIITKGIEGAFKGAASAATPPKKPAAKPMDTTTVLLLVGAIWLLSKGR